MHTLYVLAMLGLGVWALIDWWRNSDRDLEAWETARARRRANEYIERHAVPKSNHPFR